MDWLIHRFGSLIENDRMNGKFIENVINDLRVSRRPELLFRNLVDVFLHASEMLMQFVTEIALGE